MGIVDTPVSLCLAVGDAFFFHVLFRFFAKFFALAQIIVGGPWNGHRTMGQRIVIIDGHLHDPTIITHLDPVQTIPALEHSMPR